MKISLWDFSSLWKKSKVFVELPFCSSFVNTVRLAVVLLLWACHSLVYLVIFGSGEGGREILPFFNGRSLF